MSSPGSFLSELRRRHVFRVAGLYIVAAWVVLQVADLGFESWGVPASALRYVWIAALLLFPVALVFGWRYDITAHGIVRTPPASGSADLSLKTPDFVILFALVAVAAVSGWWTVEQVAGSKDASQESVLIREIDPASIAVLPFATRSSVADTAFFADGVHDDLLTSLSKVMSMKVISRTSVLRYRDTEKSIPEIGNELGVAFVLEGGVQQAGDNVRINVQLIDSRTDGHVWAHTYDRELTAQNVFAIQSEIVETIASQLRTQLTVDERRRIGRDRTDDLEAFREYTYGKQQVDIASFAALRKAGDHFRKAIEIDPEYVLAHAALANTFASLAVTGAITPGEALAQGQTHVDRAMELDAHNPFVQAVRGRYMSLTDDPQADAVMKAATIAAPNDVDVLSIYATYLRIQRRGEEALGVLRQALDLDPMSALLYHDLGRVHLWLGQFEPALEAFERIAQLSPGNPYAAHGAATATILSGDLVEAAYWSEQALSMDADDYENPATCVVIYASFGDYESARRHADLALEMGPTEPYPLSSKALLLAMTGDTEKAVATARGALARDLEDRWGSHFLFLRLVRNAALDAGEYDEALALFQKYEPGLFESPPQITAGNVRKAVDLASLLQQVGQDQQATTLLDAAITAYEQQYTLGSANYPLGIAVVDALALLGREEEAVTRLRELAEDGWRVLWHFNTNLNPSHDSLRELPAYQDVLTFIEEDLQRQVDTFSVPDVG
jgi:TolB-like protein/tetratricopeptide (TPR) repeat protein